MTLMIDKPYTIREIKYWDGMVINYKTKRDTYYLIITWYPIKKEDYGVRILQDEKGWCSNTKDAFKVMNFAEQHFEEDVKKIELTKSKLISFINNKLKNLWLQPDVTVIEIGTMKQFEKEFDDLMVYHKYRPLNHSDSLKRQWERQVMLNKPKKMESKKMYHKKSQTKKSPVKRMTGDIGQLGKNFNKLI